MKNKIVFITTIAIALVCTLFISKSIYWFKLKENGIFVVETRCIPITNFEAQAILDRNDSTITINGVPPNRVLDEYRRMAKSYSMDVNKKYCFTQNLQITEKRGRFPFKEIKVDTLNRLMLSAN